MFCLMLNVLFNDALLNVLELTFQFNTSIFKHGINRKVTDSVFSSKTYL